MQVDREKGKGNISETEHRGTGYENEMWVKLTVV